MYIPPILEETNSNSRRIHTDTHTCTWSIIIGSTDSYVCALDEGQERILLAILLNYTREEFNLVEWRECACIEKKRKERVLIAARGRKHTREVCVCMCMPVSSATFVYWFVPVIEWDRRHFLLLTGFLILHTGRSLIISYQRHTHTHTHSTRKSTIDSIYFYYSHYQLSFLNSVLYT
jgi:hypothetical protein